MYKSRRSPSPSRHRSHGRSNRSPSPRRRGSPARERHSRDYSREREKREDELPTEFCRDRDESDRRKDDNKNVLERMEKSYVGGPLYLLYKATKEQKKLKIWTRNFKEVRGICTGYVIAFDKHWNIVLSDVDEICLKPKKGKTPYLRDLKPGDLESLPEAQVKEFKKKGKKDEPESATAAETSDKAPEEPKAAAVTSGSEDEPLAEGDAEPAKGEAGPAEEDMEQTEVAAIKKKRSRKKKRTKIEKRFVNKLFIRGDNIVMISIIASGDAAVAAEAEPEKSEKCGKGGTGT